MEKNNYLTESFEAVVTNFDKVLDDLEVPKTQNASDKENLIDFQETHAVTEKAECDSSTNRECTDSVLFKLLTSEREVAEEMPSSKSSAEKAIGESSDQNTAVDQKDHPILKELLNKGTKQKEDRNESSGESFDQNIAVGQKDSSILKQLLNNGNKQKEDRNERFGSFQITTPQFLDKFAAVETYAVEFVPDTRNASKGLQSLSLIEPMDYSNSMGRQSEKELCTRPSSEPAKFSTEMSKSDLASVEYSTKLGNGDASTCFNSSTCFNTSEVVFRTRHKTHVVNFEWSLHDFHDYLNSVRSPIFSMRDCERKWQFFLTFTPIPNAELEVMELYMTRSDHDNCTIRGEFDLKFYNLRGDLMEGWKSEAIFTDTKRLHMCIQTMRPKTLEQDNSKLIDELIIKGRMKFQGCCVTTKMLQNPVLTI